MSTRTLEDQARIVVLAAVELAKGHKKRLELHSRYVTKGERGFNIVDSLGEVEFERARRKHDLLVAGIVLEAEGIMAMDPEWTENLGNIAVGISDEQAYRAALQYKYEEGYSAGRDSWLEDDDFERPGSVLADRIKELENRIEAVEKK